jgi:hypothetical protein
MQLFKQPVVNQPADVRIPGINLTVTEARSTRDALRQRAQLATRGMARSLLHGDAVGAAEELARAQNYDANADLFEHAVARFLGA